MFDKLLGFRTINKQIEEKLIQLSFIPSKYFEALYVECSTRITCHTCDICEVEEVNVRGELLKLMKQGQVDTKTEIEKYQLFQRINNVSKKSKSIRLLMTDHLENMKRENYDRLVILLKEASIAGKLMYHSVKALFENYDKAIAKVKELTNKCNKLIEELIAFRYYDQDGDGLLNYSFEEPEVLIGNSLRVTLQEMINVGEKIIHIIKTLSYNHKEKELTEEKQKKIEEKKKEKQERDKKREERKVKKEKKKKK